MTTVSNPRAQTERPVEFNPLFPSLEVGPFAEFNARNVSTAMRASTAFMKGAASYWDRMGSFMSKRLQCDAEAARAMSACRTGEDAVRTQHAFLSKMIKDYAEEAHALLSIGASIAKDVAEPIEERAEEAVRNIETKSRMTPAAE